VDDDVTASQPLDDVVACARRRRPGSADLDVNLVRVLVAGARFARPDVMHARAALLQ